MNGDYGILALEKCSQLEQRLKQLEKTTTQLRLKTLVFEGNYSGCTQAEYTAEFSVNRDGDVFVRVDADLSAVTNGTLTLYVDSEEYKQISFLVTLHIHNVNYDESHVSNFYLFIDDNSLLNLSNMEPEDSRNIFFWDFIWN